MKYFVKTRNWHCKQWVFNALQWTQRFGVVRGDSYTDGDGKFILETNNTIKAFIIMFYFLILRHFSGGWTYIQREGVHFDGKYRKFYL